MDKCMISYHNSIECLIDFLNQLCLFLRIPTTNVIMLTLCYLVCIKHQNSI